MSKAADTQLIFRDARLEDLTFIVDVYNATIPGRMVTADTEPITVQDKLDWFVRHKPEKRPLWIIEANDAPVGWASLQDFYGRPAYRGTAEISIYLAQTHRNKGYGRQILERIISQAPGLEISVLLGFIFSHNIPSIHLFTTCGFVEWGHLPDVARIDNSLVSLKILGRKV